MSDSEATQVQETPESAASEAAKAQAAAEQDITAAESEPAKEGEQDQQQDDDKKKGRLEKRFATLTARAKRAEAETQQLRQQIAQREAEAPAKTAESRPKPKPDDLDPITSQPKYANYEEFVEALADWKAEQSTGKLKAELQQQEKARTAKQETATLETQYRQRIEAAEDRYPDFEDVVLAKGSPVEDIPEGSAMDGYLLRAETGPPLLYHLAKHEDEIARIAALDPYKQVAELVKLELKLAPPESKTDEAEGGEENPAKPAAPVSKAPPPPNPVRKPGPSAKPFDPNDEAMANGMTPDEWAAKRNAQLAKRQAR